MCSTGGPLHSPACAADEAGKLKNPAPVVPAAPAPKVNVGVVLLGPAAAAVVDGNSPKVKVLAGVLLVAPSPGVVPLTAEGVAPKVKPLVLEGSKLAAGVDPAAAVGPLLFAAGVVLVLTPNVNALLADAGATAVIAAAGDGVMLGELVPKLKADDDDAPGWAAAADDDGSASLASVTAMLEPHLRGSGDGRSFIPLLPGPGVTPNVKLMPLAGAGVCPAFAMLTRFAGPGVLAAGPSAKALNVGVAAKLTDFRPPTVAPVERFVSASELPATVAAGPGVLNKFPNVVLLRLLPA